MSDESKSCQWEPAGTRPRDGMPRWKCPGCGGMVAVEQPPRLNTCNAFRQTGGTMKAAASFAEPLPCVYRGEQVAQFGCCGHPITRLYACSTFGSCTLKEHDDGLEWQGKPVATCDTGDFACKHSSNN